MAYYNPNKYKLLGELETSYSKQAAAAPEAAAGPSEAQWLNDLKQPGAQSAMASGMQSGGVSGALMTGGMVTGNPYMIGGGLLLSELEASQKAKAERERQQIEGEKSRRQNMQNVLLTNSRTRMGV